MAHRRATLALVVAASVLAAAPALAEAPSVTGAQLFVSKREGVSFVYAVFRTARPLPRREGHIPDVLVVIGDRRETPQTLSTRRPCYHASESLDDLGAPRFGQRLRVQLELGNDREVVYDRRLTLRHERRGDRRGRRLGC